MATPETTDGVLPRDRRHIGLLAALIGVTLALMFTLGLFVGRAEAAGVVTYEQVGAALLIGFSCGWLLWESGGF
jgi:putative Mn2+ efflux pump MntP